MSLTCLSRTLDPLDYQHLQCELQVVDAYPSALPYPHRKWEYAMALHGVSRWISSGHEVGAPIYALGGGADGRFDQMLDAFVGQQPVMIDAAPLHVTPLREWITSGTPLANVITCLSLVEHVPDLDAFLYHLSCLLTPGGLLVLTMAYWNRCGADTAQHHERRQRIFCPQLYNRLRTSLAALQFTSFGGVDPTWHGPQVHDYSLASLLMEKRR